MKILFFIRRFYPLIGGVEKHCLEIGKCLVAQGHVLAVVTEIPNQNSKIQIQNFKSKETYEGINIYRIPITTGEKLKKFQIWRWLLNHRKLIKEADVVHCHDVFFWYLPFRFLYPKKKVFTTFHGWEGIYPPRWQAKIIRKISEKLSFGNICVGNYIEKWYGTKADFVTYGGVGIVQSSKPCLLAGRFKAQSNSSKSKILFVGRLEKDTGLLIYLKTLAILRDRVEAKFAGDGSLRKEAEKYGTVLGFVEDVNEQMQESDFVFTSGYLSILEAMINKKLVFSVYDNPVKEDYLKMAPFSQWIVIENDPEQLAKKIKFYLENPLEEKKLIEEAYNWVRQQSWKKLTEKYLELWEKD